MASSPLLSSLSDNGVVLAGALVATVAVGSALRRGVGSMAKSGTQPTWVRKVVAAAEEARERVYEKQVGGTWFVRIGSRKWLSDGGKPAPKRLLYAEGGRGVDDFDPAGSLPVADAIAWATTSSEGWMTRGEGKDEAVLRKADPAAMNPSTAVIYFDLHTEYENVEEDAGPNSDKDAAMRQEARSLLADGHSKLDALEWSGYREAGKILGVNLSNEGHDESDLICKFGVKSIADVARINGIVQGMHGGGDDVVYLPETPYMSIQNFQFYPQGVNGKRYGPNEKDGTIAEWLEAHEIKAGSKSVGSRAKTGMSSWRDPQGPARRGGSLYDSIRSGDSVTIQTPQGNKLRGRAVMLGPGGWVLNLGGRHGTPGIASRANVVAVRKPGARGSRGLEGGDPGSWTVEGRGMEWWIVHPTKKAKYVGPVKGRGKNYHDAAQERADRLNQAASDRASRASK